MKKFVINSAILFAGVITALLLSADARPGTPPPSWYIPKAVYLRGAAAITFNVKVVRPHKIIIYPEAQHVSYAIACVKGSTVGTYSRTIVGETTRNLLWGVPGRRFDACYVSVAAAQSSGRGYVSVQAMVRGGTR